MSRTNEPSPKEKRHMQEGIDQLERYRKAKEVLEEQEQRGKAYMEKVRHDVEQDLSPLREEVEASRQSIEAYVREENGGEKFKVPGLGTAYFTNRRQTKIVDMEAFVHEMASEPEDLSTLYDDPQINSGRAKKYAEDRIKDGGELLPGVESEEVQSLTVRLGK